MSAMPKDLCILSPVWHAYRWVAPFMMEQLANCWEGHPPLHFVGFNKEEVGTLPHFPLGPGVRRESWCSMVLDGVQAARSKGFAKCYLLLEEHLPLGPCAAKFLNSTLPEVMEQLQGCYASLMGWDNRRYLKRGTTLLAAPSGWIRLDTPEAPRFHLHPAWWRLDVLECCLEQTLSGGGSSAWDFEKTNEKWTAHPVSRIRGCYQICGNVHALKPRRGAGLLLYRWEVAVLHALMRLYPAFARLKLGYWFWNLIGFDNFHFVGPYPMFFSGIMAKGGINPHASAFLSRSKELAPLEERIRTARPKE